MKTPNINLKPQAYTGVLVETREKYDELMRVYECAGWKWLGGDLPTGKNYWEFFEERTCVGAGCIEKFISGELKYGFFGCDPMPEEDRETYSQFYKNISLQEFYNSQSPKIDKGLIEKINSCFD
jgi:hypothetical protein